MSAADPRLRNGSDVTEPPANDYRPTSMSIPRETLIRHASWCVAVLLVAMALMASRADIAALQAVEADVPVDARIRALDAAGRELAYGSLSDVTRDSIRLLPPDEESRVLARSGISRLEVFAGKRRRWLTGAAIGLGAGVGLVASREFFVYACGWSVNGQCVHGRSRYVLPDTDASVIVGAAILIGGLAGSLVRSDRWRRVAWPTIRPGSGQKGASMEIRFQVPWSQ